jgi:hypothetical protein
VAGILGHEDLQRDAITYCAVSIARYYCSLGQWSGSPNMNRFEDISRQIDI